MIRLTSFLAAVVVLASTAQAVDIETVPVGNPGNDPDTRYDTPGYGSVADPYLIGKHEVTAGQYTEFLKDVGGIDTHGLYNTNMWSSVHGCKIERYDGSGTAGDPYQYQVAADYANRPVNYVSWGDAARFANWLHNGQPTGILTGNPVLDAGLTEDGAYDLNGAVNNADLRAVNREADWKWAIPTEDEWYKAAYHKNDDTANYFGYPTSIDYVPYRYMTEATNPSNNANYWGTPLPIDSPYYTTVAGEFELSESPYGTFDQGGNVWEWNEAIIAGSDRGLRGGSFQSLDGTLHASFHYHNDPTNESGKIGFRVASIPEPSTLAMLLCGIIGIACWKRRRG